MNSRVLLNEFPRDAPATSWHRITKRAFDLTVASLMLIVLSPILLLCVLAVRLSSPGPVLYRQRRVGAHGREFDLLKFRSMYVGSDTSTHQTYVASFIQGQAEQREQGDDGVYKLVGDPRITRVGRWIRRTSLDELPQFWNVVRGEMSVVGPRPPITYELEHYRPEHLRRLAVKPGITGLWQVSGRSRTTFDEMVALDLEYIRHASVLTDIRILVKTIPVVLRLEGA